MQWVAANGPGVTNGNGTVGAGGTVRLSLNFSEAVNVTGSPSLALNSNGTAKYVSGSGTNTLQFDYTVGAGQSAADLAITGFNLGGVKDQAGNTVNLSGAPTQPAGTLAIDATAPTAVTNAAVNTRGAECCAHNTDTCRTAPNLAGVPSGFGNNNTTLGYTANTATASGNFDGSRWDARLEDGLIQPVRGLKLRQPCARSWSAAATTGVGQHHPDASEATRLN